MTHLFSPRYHSPRLHVTQSWMQKVQAPFQGVVERHSRNCRQLLTEKNACSLRVLRKSAVGFDTWCLKSSCNDLNIIMILFCATGFKLWSYNLWYQWKAAPWVLKSIFSSPRVLFLSNIGIPKGFSSCKTHKQHLYLINFTSEGVSVFTCVMIWPKIIEY